MSDEVIRVLGLTLRKPAQFAASPVCEPCEYLKRGFCTVCDCDQCENGMLLEEWRAANRAGNWSAPLRECACVRRARNRKHLRDSGLEMLVKRCTFDSYQTDTPWRQKVKALALEYLENSRHTSFFIGGQSGSGKTHICTAIAGALMERGKRLRYFQWVKDATRLKQLVSDPAQYERELRPYLDAPYLYIDDLFRQEITDADLRLFYELLNGRYNNDLPTLLSSERSLTEIRNARGGSGEALAGRIFEMCGRGTYCLELTGADKNDRFYRKSL